MHRRRLATPVRVLFFDTLSGALSFHRPIVLKKATLRRGTRTQELQNNREAESLRAMSSEPKGTVMRTEQTSSYQVQEVLDEIGRHAPRLHVALHLAADPGGLVTMPRTKLAKSLGVSPCTVRDTAERLQSVGLVQIVRGRSARGKRFVHHQLTHPHASDPEAERAHHGEGPANGH